MVLSAISRPATLKIMTSTFNWAQKPPANQCSNYNIGEILHGPNCPTHNLVTIFVPAATSKPSAKCMTIVHMSGDQGLNYHCHEGINRACTKYILANFHLLLEQQPRVQVTNHLLQKFNPAQSAWTQVIELPAKYQGKVVEI